MVAALMASLPFICSVLTFRPLAPSLAPRLALAGKPGVLGPGLWAVAGGAVRGAWRLRPPALGTSSDFLRLTISPLLHYLLVIVCCDHIRHISPGCCTTEALQGPGTEVSDGPRSSC